MRVFLAIGYVIGLAVFCKIMEHCTKRTPKQEIQTCTRPAPHICKVNGPCNGYPKETK